MNSISSEPRRALPLPVLAVALVALIWAGEAFAVQQATLICDTPIGELRLLKRESLRLLFDLLACGTCVCLIGTRWLYPVFAGSTLLSYALLAYQRSFRQPLSWTTIVSQFGEGADNVAAGASALLGDLWLPAALAVALILKIGIMEWSARGRVNLRAAGFKLGAAYLGMAVTFVVWLRPMSGLATWESVARTGTMYGYFLTWVGEAWYVNEDELLEMALKRAAQTDAARHPVPEARLEPPERLVVVQMESVAYVMLDAELDDEFVMPFLHDLSSRSMTYRVRAVHDAGSSDADFAFLMDKLPVGRVNPYKIVDFPFENSMVRRLDALGYECSALHGNRGTFFSRRNKFNRIGFDHVYFRRELEAANLAPGAWGIPDHDVLRFGSSLVRQSPRQFLFAITLTTHSPFTYLPAEAPLPNSPDDSLWLRYQKNMRYIDDCLRSFVADLPAGTLVVLYGDHEPGIAEVARQRTDPHEEYVPFLIHRTGDDLSTRQQTRDSGLATSGELSMLDLAHYVWQQVLVEEAATTMESRNHPGLVSH